MAPDTLTDFQQENLLQREARQSCGDVGPTITGGPEGWWEAACEAVGREQQRMIEAKAAGAAKQRAA